MRRSLNPAGSLEATRVNRRPYFGFSIETPLDIGYDGNLDRRYFIIDEAAVPPKPRRGRSLGYTPAQIKKYLMNQFEQDSDDEPAWDTQYGRVIKENTFFGKCKHLYIIQHASNLQIVHLANIMIGTDSMGFKSHMRRFSDFPKRGFQLGTDGLIGCTMVVIISKRAVWMVSELAFRSHVFRDAR